MILVDQEIPSGISQFAEHYRLLVYSISDFLIGMALLYLFYCQGRLLVKRARIESEDEISKFKDLGGLPDLQEVTKFNYNLGVQPNANQLRHRDTWEGKVLSKKESSRESDNYQSSRIAEASSDATSVVESLKVRLADHDNNKIQGKDTLIAAEDDSYSYNDSS